MRRAGVAYLIALFCLLFVSSVAMLWQRQLAAQSTEISDAWTNLLAEQAAFSGIEYAKALLAGGRDPGRKIEISVPEGFSRFVITREAGVTKIFSEGFVRRQGKIIRVMRSSHWKE